MKYGDKEKEQYDKYGGGGHDYDDDDDDDYDHKKLMMKDKKY